MKKFLWWLAMNGGFAAAVWSGFLEGIEGAQYLAKFWVWAVSAPMAFMAVTDAVQKKLAAEPPTPPTPARTTRSGGCPAAWARRLV